MPIKLYFNLGLTTPAWNGGIWYKAHAEEFQVGAGYDSNRRLCCSPFVNPPRADRYRHSGAFDGRLGYTWNTKAHRQV